MGSVQKITVKNGDTLAKIAKANNTTVEQLAKLNNIKDVNILKAGQKLVLTGDKGVALEHQVSDAKLEKQIAEQQKEIQALKDRTIASQVKQEVVEKYNSVKKEVKAVEKKVVDTGKAIYKGGKKVIRTGIETGETVDRTIATYAKNFAHTARGKLKADLTPAQVHKQPNFKKMTKAQILAYQQKEIQALKNKTISQQLREEIKENIRVAENAVKSFYNSGVDAVYNGVSKAYHTVANGVKGMYSWAKSLFD